MRTWTKEGDWFRIGLYRQPSESAASARTMKLWDALKKNIGSARLYDADATEDYFRSILPGQTGWTASAITEKDGDCGTFAQYLGTSFGPMLIYIEYSRKTCLDIADDNGISLMRMAQLQTEKILAKTGS
jgi:hypothetical protein